MRWRRNSAKRVLAAGRPGPRCGPGSYYIEKQRDNVLHPAQDLERKACKCRQSPRQSTQRVRNLLRAPNELAARRTSRNRCAKVFLKAIGLTPTVLLKLLRSMGPSFEFLQLYRAPRSAETAQSTASVNSKWFPDAGSKQRYADFQLASGWINALESLTVPSAAPALCEIPTIDTRTLCQPDTSWFSPRWT